MTAAKIIFVTGTDTGVGKTLFTALLLQHLRATGHRALAMKPFCSGSRADVKLLQSLQPGELTDDEANPYFFAEPVAPLIAKEARHRIIKLNDVLVHVRAVQAKCDTLLIEGSGGLLVPLAKRFTVADLIGKLPCRVIVVARNRLGTINHTLLTLCALQLVGKELLAVALMSASKTGDLSSRTNHRILRKLLKAVPVQEFPYLGRRANQPLNIKESISKVQGHLRSIAKSIHAN